MSNFELHLLSTQFYNDYMHCQQILKNNIRPYIVILLEIDGDKFAIPLRSNEGVAEYKIKKKAKDKIIRLTKNSENKNKCIDFSKTVIISTDDYIGKKVKLLDSVQKVDIFSFKDEIEKQLKRYIHQYKKKFMLLEAGKYNKEAYYFCATSSLLYFHQFLGLEDPFTTIEATKDALISSEQIQEFQSITI